MSIGKNIIQSWLYNSRLIYKLVKYHIPVFQFLYHFQKKEQDVVPWCQNFPRSCMLFSTYKPSGLWSCSRENTGMPVLTHLIRRNSSSGIKSATKRIMIKNMLICLFATTSGTSVQYSHLYQGYNYTALIILRRCEGMFTESNSV